MENIKIFSQENSELSEFEAIHKGYRNDIVVKVSYNYYQLSIYDIVRLTQDFNTEIEHKGFYEIDPNLVLVKEVNRTEVISTIHKLVAGNYFSLIKPVNIESIDYLLVDFK